MKYTILSLAILLMIPFTTLAQDAELKKLFEKYKNKSGFELEIEDADFDINFEKDFNLGSFFNNMKSIYILECEHHETINNDRENFELKLDKLIGKKNFNTIIDVKSDEVFTMMNRKNSDDQITDLLMIVKEDNESTYIWVSGE